MVGSATVGVEYPGLYAVATHAIIVVEDTLPWVVDTHRCVLFEVIGEPWDEPTTWLIISGVLPVCLTFIDGEICGTPMKVGSTTLVIQATDASGRVLTFTYHLIVGPKP